MKLNNFFNKSNKQQKPNAKVISFVNETQDNAWRAEVQKLQAEIDRLKTVDEERSAFSQRMQSAEIRLTETLERELAGEAHKVLLEEEVKQGEVLKTTNQALENELRDIKGQLGIKESHLEQAAHNNLELNGRVSRLTEQVEESSQRESGLKQGLEEAIQRAAASKHDLQETEYKFSEKEVKLHKVTEIYDNLKNDYDKLNIVAEYWRKVSETIQAENNELAQTDAFLQQLQKDVKVERTQQKGVSKIQKEEINNLQGQLTAMTDALEYFTGKNQYLLGLVSSLRKEVAKPRYLSMSSIAQKEGFKMPLGNENIRKHFLGTSAPTLLKFKVKEDGNDN
jgi:chromosome segregation ATPase